MPKENEDLLKEIYKATQMGLEATKEILNKVEDASLHDQIVEQRKNYKGMSLKAKAMLREQGEVPLGAKASKKIMVKSAVTMNTLTNRSPSHIAELMINGTTMGIIDMTKRMNRLDYSDAGAKQLAEEFISNQQQSIENLKGFLC